MRKSGSGLPSPSGSGRASRDGTPSGTPRGFASGASAFAAFAPAAFTPSAFAPGVFGHAAFAPQSGLAYGAGPSGPSALVAGGFTAQPRQPITPTAAKQGALSSGPSSLPLKKRGLAHAPTAGGQQHQQQQQQQRSPSGTPRAHAHAGPDDLRMPDANQASERIQVTRISKM